MKVLHFFKQEKFTKSVVEFYDKFFKDKGHEVCYINSINNSSIRNDVLISQKEIFLTKNITKMRNEFCNLVLAYDYLVFHSFQFSKWILLFLFLDKKILKKVVWIEWGADLYSWKIDSRSVRARYLNYMSEVIRTKCHSVVCIFPPDCDIYKKEFPRSNAKVYYAPYCGATIPQEYLNYNIFCQLKYNRENNEPIYIQVGHSATSQMHHIEVLQKLKKFSHENIRIFMPLSYGDMKYADKVQEYAERNFGEKVICLRQMLPKEEYFKLIDRVDIAIFNTYRQIALGNINRMIFKNIKIYMPKDSIMYKYFRENYVPIQVFEDIDTGNFDDFISNIEIENKDRFYDYLNRCSDIEWKVSQWQYIYEELRSSCLTKD